MHGIGKKTAWKIWKEYPHFTQTFKQLIDDPSLLEMSSPQMQHLERFTVLLYSKSCAADSVNEARKAMFTNGLKLLEAIPPTQHALFQHAKRALLAASFVWKQSLLQNQQLPDPGQWGWEWNSRTKLWVPFWTELPDASHGCSLLLHCGCTVACTGNCKCSKAGLHCSSLCKCEGGCTNNDKE